MSAKFMCFHSKHLQLFNSHDVRVDADTPTGVHESLTKRNKRLHAWAPEPFSFMSPLDIHALFKVSLPPFPGGLLR